MALIASAVFNSSLLPTVQPLSQTTYPSIDDIVARHSPAKTIVDKYATPVWYVIGFPCNVMSFLVWIRPRMRHSSGCYLAALAMVDLVFLVLQLVFELETTWQMGLLNAPVLCEGFPIVFLTSQYLSPVLVLCFTVERYISVCHPFKREKYCSTSRAIKVITSIVMSCLLLNLIQGYFWTYNGDECSLREEVIAQETTSLWSLWTWVTEMLVFGAVPLTILILDLMVICETRKLSQLEEKRICLKQKRNKKSGTSATTAMLLAVSFYLIFTTLPVTVCYTLFYNFPAGDATLDDAQIDADPTWQNYFTYWLTRAVIQEIGMSHYACNFIIYCLKGKVFREEVRRLLVELMCCRDKSQNIWHTRSTHFDDMSSRRASTRSALYDQVTAHDTRARAVHPGGATDI
ncbi:hypothetical protein NP493_692g07037 [Ridgeia piscesae]|uniref:G-protein coupled receptors family 1 profile domain-containing protein n=1 Tax=Ridgeia piscesae TaxID=27915 RepID=A0AAD9KR55_RIDPI|nr:hypothetical protein NP493_692g07037 [Ridgeia piscesae]